MLHAFGAVLLLGAVAVFAVYAALLNERNHAGRRSGPGRAVAPPTAPIAVPSEQSAEVPGAPSGDRRLPVGDFLFGALFLRGPEPLAFSALADAAAGSGMSVAQVLVWIERAEASGLIERGTDDDSGEPAVRLTEMGIYAACHDRRRAKRAHRRDRSPATRALNG